MSSPAVTVQISLGGYWFDRSRLQTLVSVLYRRTLVLSHAADQRRYFFRLRFPGGSETVGDDWSAIETADAFAQAVPSEVVLQFGEPDTHSRIAMQLVAGNDVTQSWLKISGKDGAWVTESKRVVVDEVLNTLGVSFDWPHKTPRLISILLITLLCLMFITANTYWIANAGTAAETWRVPLWHLLMANAYPNEELNEQLGTLSELALWFLNLGWQSVALMLPCWILSSKLKWHSMANLTALTNVLACTLILFVTVTLAVRTGLVTGLITLGGALLVVVLIPRQLLREAERLLPRTSMATDTIGGWHPAMPLFRNYATKLFCLGTAAVFVCALIVSRLGSIGYGNGT